MQSMSFDPAVADIGSQVVNNAFQGLQAGAVAWVSLSSLLPAGAGGVGVGGNGVHDGGHRAAGAESSGAGRAEKGGRGVYRDRPDVFGRRRQGGRLLARSNSATRPDPRAGIVRRDARRIS